MMGARKEKAMLETDKYARPLHLQEGWLCLDFANTLEWRATDQPTERLNDYPNLVSWAQGKGVISEGEVEHLVRSAEVHPAQASAVLNQAITLRETIYRIFSAVVAGRSPETADLAALNAALSQGMAHLRIIQTAAGFVWDWDGGEDALDQMLWPVVRSAVDLLTSKELERVGECAGDWGCGWLFLDMSRNHSRRWCSMELCGNRAKVRRHYQRHSAA
jgi:predicted RNA-binding Zn ribbon-like protein